MAASELDEIVGELYLVPPTDFVSVRNDLVGKLGRPEIAGSQRNCRACAGRPRARGSSMCWRAPNRPR